jgi:hypothetical protein
VRLDRTLFSADVRKMLRIAAERNIRIEPRSGQNGVRIIRPRGVIYLGSIADLRWQHIAS